MALRCTNRGKHIPPAKQTRKNPSTPPHFPRKKNSEKKQHVSLSLRILHIKKNGLTDRPVFFLIRHLEKHLPGRLCFCSTGRIKLEATFLAGLPNSRCTEISIFIEKSQAPGSSLEYPHFPKYILH